MRFCYKMTEKFFVIKCLKKRFKSSLISSSPYARGLMVKLVHFVSMTFSFILTYREYETWNWSIAKVWPFPWFYTENVKSRKKRYSQQILGMKIWHIWKWNISKWNQIWLNIIKFRNKILLNESNIYLEIKYQ